MKRNPLKSHASRIVDLIDSRDMPHENDSLASRRWNGAHENVYATVANRSGQKEAPFPVGKENGSNANNDGNAANTRRMATIFGLILVAVLSYHECAGFDLTALLRTSGAEDSTKVVPPIAFSSSSLDEVARTFVRSSWLGPRTTSRNPHGNEEAEELAAAPFEWSVYYIYIYILYLRRYI